jgi:pyruvate/2-oxoglutarate dehydrogenase complex dihydrolipoamide acyltransferase (E2) component
VSSSSTETGVDVTMPQMGVSVSEGTVVEWRKRAGDWVAYEEPICDISTDKIDTEVPAPAAGRLTEIFVEIGTTVEVGTVLARIATDARPGEAHASEHDPPPPPATGEAAAATGDSPAPATSGPAPAPAAASASAGAAVASVANGTRRYSPVVQRIAAEHGVDLSRVPGTGRDGRVRKQDVLAYLESGGGADVATEPPLHSESPYRPEPEAPRPGSAPAASTAPAPGGLSRMRRSIGEHMKRSLETAATCTTWIEVDFSRVESARRALGITALPIVARATVEALHEFPSLNATLEGEAYARFDDAVHLGIAVSLGEDGLIVPVVQDAQDLSAEGLAKRIKDLARRARSRDLVPDEVRGGTFTITNPGQYGTIMATPVINQPQVAILDLEAVVKRPVVVTDAAGNDAVAIRPMCILGLSWDHRALDGALAARFLAALRSRLETN